MVKDIIWIIMTEQYQIVSKHLLLIGLETIRSLSSTLMFPLTLTMDFL